MEIVEPLLSPCFQQAQINHCMLLYGNYVPVYSLNIFYVSLQNLYHISILLIARMSSKFGKIRTETRSWRPKWPLFF